jgi:hypothetical protein
VRGIETTVRALGRARVRHFAIGVMCGALAVLAFIVHDQLVKPLRGTEVLRSDVGIAAWVAHRVPATAAMVTISEWVMLIAGGLAWYHLREWRGKARRYRNQRHRAANQLLRADFRRSVGP